MTRRHVFAGGSAILIWAAAGLAQSPCAEPPDNCVTNGSFEQPLFGNPNALEPQGWHNHSDPAECIYRRNGDGLVPAVTARTGERCVQVAAPTPEGFRSFSTDVHNFFAPGFPWYDISIDWNGGDIIVEGWFMIPESDPIEGEGFAAMKLSLKGAADPNQDNIVVDGWSNAGPEIFHITGHTCGEWVQYRVVWPMAVAHTQILDFMVGAEPNQRPYDPALDGVPNRLKIALGHHHFNTPASGVIFWDDIRMVQLPIGATLPPVLPPIGSELCPPTNDCRADFNHDTFVNPDDLADFITCFFLDVQFPGICAESDFNADGFRDPDDLADFITVFFLAVQFGC